MAPLADPKIGAVTCFYVSTDERSFVDRLQSVGMMSDFYAGIVVAWQLDGVKFALGPTIATTRERLAGFGGYESIENRPADDLLVGRLIADQGYEVELSAVTGGNGGRLPIHPRVDAQAAAVDRGDALHAPVGPFRPVVHAWAAMVAGCRGGSPVAGHRGAYLGGYFAMRCAITAMIAIWGLKQRLVLAKDGADPGVGRAWRFRSGWPVSRGAASAGAEAIITFAAALWCR